MEFLLERPKVESCQAASPLCAEAQLGNQLHLNQKGQENESCPVREEFWHVAAAKCIALGMSMTETATMVDKHLTTIKVIVRNPVFQARVLKYMEDAGTSMAEMFRADALAARATLIEINNDPKVSPSVRVSAAKEILDRHMGKATQYIESKTQTISADPHVREAELLREIKTLRTSQDLVQDLSDERDTTSLS
jgi:hypothetical protein